MFCIIQQIERKKPNTYGAHKEILVSETSFSFPGQEQKVSYGYRYSEERFERPVKTAYKISIHESYRENGKVKKKQWVICTMGYYDLMDFSLYDFAGSRIRNLADEVGKEEEFIYGLIFEKLTPLIEQVEAAFQQTEEYKTKQEHDKIKTLYEAHRIEFEAKYGRDTYKYCYDIFGELRNPQYLEQLKASKKASEEYQKRSYEEGQKRFNEQYYDYFNGGGSSYSTISISNYNDDEKKLLHEIYRMASKKFHPDVCGDDGSKMKFLTKLKDQWGL